MAKLHDTLKLTSAQEAAWSDFSNKMKPVTMDKPEMNKPGHQDWKDMSTPDRLDKMLDRIKSREKLMAEHAEETAGLVIEPIVQGAGGMIVQPAGFVRRVRELWDKYDIFMKAHRVAVCFGRA